MWQAVYLDPGTHILTWRDQARTQEGKVARKGSGSVPSTLRAGLYDEDWTGVATQTEEPFIWDGSQDDKAQLWSDRRKMVANVTLPGPYYVAFSASMLHEAPGSVAIANVQLERVAGPGSSPSAYVQTANTRRYSTGDCEKLSAQEFRRAFKHVCEDGIDCYYELKRELIIDTSTLGDKGSRLNGKLASGNFSFRHITSALNLVGTGIRACADDAGMGCYAAGYTEYSMRHDAFETKIIGWNGVPEIFSFGAATINHGKAISTERYISFPIGSSDHGMLAQPGIEKVEFSGRPLDGHYGLRIWDDGSMRWNRLEDIQVVLRYRYWSRIEK